MGNICLTNKKHNIMGISRDSRHKRRLTGGRMPIHKKKRKFESGKPAAMTKLAEKRIRMVRTRGGKHKFRALRLNTGNFNWQSEKITKKTKLINVVYNPVSNELVRTNTLTKGSIVYVDALPFVKYVQGHYFGKYDITKDDKVNWEWENKEGKEFKFDKNNKDIAHRTLHRRLNTTIEKNLQDALNKGNLLVKITSRPGQSGRCDGCVLEGQELQLYLKKLPKRR